LPRDRGSTPARARRTVGETFAVDTATATLVRDNSRRDAWTLLLDGVESSHVDLDDPRFLAFEYVRWFGDVIDCLAPAAAPLDTVHLGGGGLTLARYVMATRPSSSQLVFEIDAALIDLVRRTMPLPKGRRLRIRIGDAGSGLAGVRECAWDVVVRDAFRDAVVPDHLRTVECATAAKRALRPTGLYLMNVADRSPFAATGVELATLLEVFGDVAVISEPAVLRGRRHGNLVVLASNTELPVDAVARRVADGGVQGRVRDLAEVKAMARGHRPLRAADLVSR
jgi:hypothetical protein